MLFLGFPFFFVKGPRNGVEIGMGKRIPLPGWMTVSVVLAKQRQRKTQILLGNDKQRGSWLAGGDPEEAVGFYAAAAIWELVPGGAVGVVDADKVNSHNACGGTDQQVSSELGD